MFLRDSIFFILLPSTGSYLPASSADILIIISGVVFLIARETAVAIATAPAID